MNNIADANATEMRGWVMLMLQRAAENVNPSECNDPAVLLACSLGSDSCPAACQKSADEKSDEPETSNINDMPVAGDLTVAVADYSDTIKSVPARGTVIFNAVDFKASEKVVIESVKLERTGLSDKSAIKWVWFEKDGVAVSAKASVTTDGVATTRFYNNFSVNGTDTLDFVVELSGAAGSEIAFNIAGVTSTAKNVSANTKTSTYRTTNYSVSTAKFEVNGAASTDATTTNANIVSYKVGDSNSYEIGRFQITNDKGSSSEDRAIIVKSLKLKNNGDLDLGDTFKNVVVKRDSKVVSKNVVLDGKNMTIYFDDNEIESGKRAIYTISAEVAQLNEVNRVVWLTLNKTSELVANEKSTNFRTNVEGKDVSLRSYLFKGGKVTFTNDSNMSKTVNAAESSTDVVIAKGTLTVSEPIKLSTITFKTLASNTVKASDVIKNLKLEIGGSTYYTKLEGTCNANAACSYVTEDSEIYVSKTSDIRVLLDLNTNIAWNPSIAFENLNNALLSTNGNTFENSDSTLNKNDVAWTIQLAKLTVKAGKFNVTNKKSSTQKVVKWNSDEVVIFDGEITSKDGRISVNDIILSGEFKSSAVSPVYWLDGTENITVSIEVDGSPFSTATFTDHAHQNATAWAASFKTVKFSSLGDVESDRSMKVVIKAQPNVQTAWSITFKILASGTDANGNAVEATPVDTAKIEITGNSEATIANSSASSTVVKDGSNAELLSFTTTIKNGSYDLSKLVVTTTLAPTTSATLAIDGKDVDSATANWTQIEFWNVNETLAIGAHTIVVKANLNADNNQTPIKVTNVELHDGNGKNGEKSLDITKLVTKAYPVISATKSSDDLILKIANPKDSEENIEILGFNIDGKLVTASFDDKSLDLSTLTKAASAAATDKANLAKFNQLIAAKRVSIAPDSSTELRIQASKWNTIQVSAIVIRVAQTVYVLTDSYSNIGKWADFKVTASGDQPTTADGYYVARETEANLKTAAETNIVSTKYNIYTLSVDATAHTASLVLKTSAADSNAGTTAMPAAGDYSIALGTNPETYNIYTLSVDATAHTASLVSKASAADSNAGTTAMPAAGDFAISYTTTD